MIAPHPRHVEYERRIASLRELASVDPIGARDVLWAWINEISAYAPYRRRGALAELDQLFRAGQAYAEYANGHSVIGVPNSTIGPVIDRLTRVAFDLWTPWRGKHWSREAGYGATTVTAGYAMLIRMIHPRHTMVRVGTSPYYNAYMQPMVVRPSVEVPDLEVLVLDYPGALDQAWPLKLVHDELTAIIPGVWLAKVFLHIGRGPGQRNIPIAYFPIKVALAHAGEAPLVLPGQSEPLPLTRRV